MKAFFNKIGVIVQYIIGGLILFFVGGFFVVLAYSIYTKDDKIIADFQKNSKLIISQTSEFIKNKKFESARAMLRKYQNVESIALDELGQKNDSLQIADIKTKIAATPANAYKLRVTLYESLTSFAAGNTQEHRDAKAAATAEWDKVKDKIGTYEDDCDSSMGKSLAYVMLRDWVEKKLLSPSSAKYPWQDEINITVTKPCDFSINGHVDSQNQYGAMVRSYYKGKLRRDLNNKDRFTLIKLEM